MDLLKILDSTPEPTIIDPNNFVVDSSYAKSNDYKILTPLTDFQKELFDQIVSLHYSDILKFFIQFQNDDANLKDQLIIDSLKVLLQNSSAVSNHPYLLIDHFFPKNLNSKDMNKKLTETSGKFKILNDLIDIIIKLYVAEELESPKKGRTSPTRVKYSGEEAFNLVIVSQLGKCMDLIESLLLPRSCSIRRYAGDRLAVNTKSKKGHGQQLQQLLNLTQDEESPLIIHLLPSDHRDLNENMYDDLLKKDNLNLLISFDISVNTDEEYLHSLVIKNKMPIIRLVPNNTIEHIALYFRNSYDDTSDFEYLKPVTAAIVCLRDKVGLIPSELKSVYATNLKYLTDWFRQLSPTTLINPVPSEKLSWPLPDLRPVKNFDSKDVERSLLTEVKFENDEDELLQLPNHYKISPKTKISYYKSKRLQGLYITNPIEYASYNRITGISSNVPENTNILTHKMILNYNLILQKDDILAEEYNIFDKMTQARMKDLALTEHEFDKIKQEVSDLRSNIVTKNDDIRAKQSQIDTLKEELKEITLKIELDTEKFDYMQRKELKDAIDSKIDSKKQENEYMLKEISNAQNSMNESVSQIENLQKDNIKLMEMLAAKPLIEHEFNTVDNSKLIKSNEELIKILEKNLKKISDIPISQKLRINGVNNHIFGGQTARR